MSRLKTDAIRNVNASVDGITLDTSGNVAIPNELQLADKIVHTGDTNTAIRFSGADTIQLETGGSNRLKIDANGVVQITRRLELTNSGDNHAVYEGRAWAWTSNGTSSGTVRGYVLTDGSSNLKLGTNGWNERLRIDQYGRVMIGTSTAGDGGADDLNIATTGQTGITIRSGTGSGGQIYFADGTSGDDRQRGIISYQHGGNYMRFYTDATERLRIDSSGRVGIGTASPGHKLSILGGSSSQLEIKGTEADLWLNSTGPSGGGIWRILGSTGGSTHRFRIYDNTNSREPFYIDGGTGHSTFTRASTGTVAHFITNARECNILLQNDARTWKIVNYDYTNAGADNLGFHDGTADRFIIKNNGNVQIPDGDLEVASGHGIDFSAQTASSASGVTNDGELLDHYERGTWNPGFQTSNGNWSGGVNVSNGNFVRVGKLVYVFGRVSWSSTGGTGNMQIINLPFSIANGSDYDGQLSIGYREGVSYPRVHTSLSTSANRINLHYVDSN